MITEDQQTETQSVCYTVDMKMNQESLYHMVSVEKTFESVCTPLGVAYLHGSLMDMPRRLRNFHSPAHIWHFSFPYRCHYLSDSGVSGPHQGIGLHSQRPL